MGTNNSHFRRFAPKQGKNRGESKIKEWICSSLAASFSRVGKSCRYYKPPVLWRDAAWLKLLSRLIGRSSTSYSKDGASKPGNWRWPFRLTTSGDWPSCWRTSAGDCNGFMKRLVAPQAWEKRNPGLRLASIRRRGKRRLAFNLPRKQLKTCRRFLPIWTGKHFSPIIKAVESPYPFCRREQRAPANRMLFLWP